MCALLRVSGGGQNFSTAKLYFGCWMPVMEQLCVVVACSVRVIGSLGALYGSVAGAGVWLLSLFSSSVQVEHQRNLGYMGFMVIGSPSPLCDML